MECSGLSADVYSDYILGTLIGPELAELKGHLESGCSRCGSELASARNLWFHFAVATPPVEPDRALRRRVIATVQQPRRFGWWQPVAALATLALAVFAGAQVGSRTSPPIVAVLPTLAPTITTPTPPVVQSLPSPAPAPAPVIVSKPQENGALVAQLAQAEQELAGQKEKLAAAERDREDLSRKYQAMLAQPKPDTSALEGQLSAARLRTQQLEHDVAEYRTLLVKARERLAPVQTASLLADPNLRLVKLRVSAGGSPAEAHALVSSGTQVVFYASHLPALPAGRAYQLWLIRASAPAIVSAGVFQPDAQNKAVVQFNNAAFTSGITTIAVTDEPEGGSSTPTGHKLLIGS